MAVVLLGGALSRVMQGSDDTSDVGAGSRLAELAWGAIYALTLLALFRRRETILTLVARSKLLIILIVFICLSTLWSVDPALTARRCFGLVGTSTIGYYLVARYSIRAIVTTIVGACAFAAAVSALAILVRPEFGEMQYPSAGTWRGIFVEKNALGQMMALGILTASILLFSSARSKALAIATIIICSVMLVGSRSVTSLLILVAVLSAFTLFRLGRRGGIGLVSSVAIVVIIATVTVAAMVLGVDTSPILSEVGRDETLTGRTEIWDAVLGAIGDRPGGGFGYGTFWLPDGSWTQYFHHGWRPYHAHNGYLELALDAGVVGVALFAIVATFGLIRGVRFALRSDAVEAIWPLLVIFEFLLVNGSESSIAKYNQLNWVLFVAAYLSTIRPLEESVGRDPTASGGKSRASARILNQKASS